MRTAVRNNQSMFKKTAIATAVLTVLGSTGSAVAGEEMKSPYAMADDSWITIDGTVKTVTPDEFTLDYGDGSVIVEMDDGDRDADAYKLLPGDKVTVSGLIDDDFLETTTIEASSVYVDSIGTTFFSSAVDEETFNTIAYMSVVPVEQARVEVAGTITDIDGEEFTVSIGTGRLSIDVEDMSFNPLDDEGYLQLDVGDRVRVFGEMDREFFDEYELDAETIVKVNI